MEYARILESAMEAVRVMAENPLYYDMMESSRKLVSSLHISFCYGGLQRIFSALPSFALCRNVMGKAETPVANKR